jgi:hypothetical protein
VIIYFSGGPAGEWAVASQAAVRGPALPIVQRLSMLQGRPHIDASWSLRGVTSHLRYTTRFEAQKLARSQPSLGRAQATCAALIPIRKSEAWWALAQDERREIYEERSRHTSIGLEYLPRIARRLHHCRDLGQPFDFLTWFEFAPEHSAAFDELLGRLRASVEWDFVDREMELRLTRAQ